MSGSEKSRKIAVIFVADVVGYSQHMKKDEDETLLRFRACRKILEKLFQLQEAIDYDGIQNPAHKRVIKDLIDQAVAMATRNPDDDNYMTTQDAADFAMKNR